MRKSLRALLQLLTLSYLLFALSTVLAPPAAAIPLCGDGVCQTSGHPFGEDCEICPEDCGGSCTICGNSFCTYPETSCTCSADCGSCPGTTDTDGDGVYDDTDNCVNTHNPNQANCDGDAKGDACDDVNGTYQQVDYRMCYASGASYGDGTSDTYAYFESRYVDTSACNNPDFWANAGSPYHYCSDLSYGYDCCVRWFGSYDCAVNYGFYSCH